MSYASEVLADSPIIYLKLDETSGTVAHDSSGNGHHFTYNAGATLGATSNLLNSVMAQGSGAAPIATLMSMPDAFTDFTIECWVTVDTTAERGAFVKIGDDHSGYAVGVGGTDYDGNGNQLIGLAEDTSWMQTGASIGTGEHHVVSYRRSSDNAWFHFLDGTQVNVVYASRILPLTRIDIGGDTASSRWLTPGVKVNHVSIYNYELGATRIAAHYAAGIATTPLPRYEVAVLADTPLIYLKLDETSGTTAVDSSGNGYDFTYGAGVSFASGTNDLGTMVSGSGSVQIASIPMPATIHDFAIECWVTLDDTSQSGPFVKIGGTGGYAVGVGSTDFNTAGNQLLSVPDGSSGILSSGTSLTAGEQHQVVLTWHVDTARWRVYLDKVLVYDANTGRSWPFDYIFIGADWNWTSYLSSGVKINHVSIYDHELTAARVVAHYAALPSARIIANDVSSQGFVYDPASITSDDAYIGELSSAVDAFSDTPFPDFVGYPDAEIFPARPVGVLSQDALLPSSALVVTSGDFVDTQDTTGRALTSPTSANHPDSTAGSWYRYTPSTDGTVTLDTTLSILDTYIFLMADDLTTIVAEDDDSGDLHGGVEFTSWLQASVVGGTTYYICVCGYDIDPSYSTGIVTLQLAGPEPVTYVPPTNTVIPFPDITADSVEMFLGTDVRAYSTVDDPVIDTTDSVEILPDPVSALAVVHEDVSFAEITNVIVPPSWNWTPIYTLDFEDTTTQGFTTVIGRWMTPANATENTYQGTRSLRLEIASPNSSLDAANAIVITSGTFADGQYTPGRTGNGPRNTPGAWYVYTPSIDGLLTISTVGAYFDTYLYLLAADAVTVLAFDDDSGRNHGGYSSTSWLQYSVVAGTTYYINATGYGSGAVGTMVLNLDGPAPTLPLSGTLNDNTFAVLPHTEYSIQFPLSALHTRKISVDVMDAAGAVVIQTWDIGSYYGDGSWSSYGIGFDSGNNTEVRLRLSDSPTAPMLPHDVMYVDNIRVVGRTGAAAHASTWIYPVHITADNAVVEPDWNVDTYADIPAPEISFGTEVLADVIVAIGDVPLADDGAPPAPITGLIATPIDMWTIQLDWTNPTDPSRSYIIIMRSPGLPYAHVGDNNLDTDIIAYVVWDPAQTTYTDSSGLAPGATYHYAVYSINTFGVAADVAATVSTTAAPPPAGELISLTLDMPAGTFSILPGTPITPGVGEVIEYYGVPMTITLSDPVGVSWSNNGTQPPPVRPGTTSTTPPPTYFDPAITRTDTDIRAEVWDQTNTTKIGDLSYSAARQFLDEYNGVGSGNLKVPADVVGAGAELLRRDRVVRFYYKDIPDAVFASIVEGRKTAVIAEAGSNWTEITGRGTLAWLEDAVVLPYVDSSDLPLSSTGISVASDGTRTVVESNLQETSPDVRAFNFGSRDAWKHVLFDDTGSGSGGSDPGLTATWTMPVGVKYTNRTDIVKGNPVKWPDKTAYWIWPTNPQADVKDGLNAYFRESFYISVAMDVYVHVTADNYSWFYIDGVQIGTSVNFMGVDQPHAWTRRLVHLEPGVHFFQARVQNANTPAVKYNPAGLLMAITRVSDGAMITHSAPTVAWEVTLTKVSFATNAADVGPGWHRPLGVKQSVKKPLNLKEYFPVDWPDGNAKWIWGSDPTTTSPPEQVCYFRAKVWIEQTGTYRWFCTADDGHVTWIDGIEVASLGYEGTAASGWQRSDEVDVDLVAGWHVFSMRGQNQTNSNIHNARGNPAAVLGTLMKIDKNGKPSTVVPDVHTDSVGIRADMGWYANWVCPAWKAGDVLLTLLEEAQARGVTRLLGVQVDFNRDTDSNGQPWTTRVSRTWDIGTSLLKVAFDLCELGVDIWMTPDNYLHCAEKRGTSDPTFSILYGVNVTGYDVDETFAGASVAYTRTRTGWFTLTNETSQLILGGKRETGISLANTDSEDAMVGLSHRAIGAVVMANMVATAGAIVPVPGSIPWVDAGIGDLIYVLAPNGGQRMGRLLSISVGENEAGATTWVPEIEIWSSPFGDGVDPTKPQDPVDPNNPFDPSTWVPAAEDWTRFIPGSSSATGDYAKRVTLAEADAMVAGENPGYYGTPGPSPSPSGATPTPANSAPHPRPAPNSLNKKTPPNAERVHVADAEPLTTSGFHLWVDTSGVV